MIKKSLIIGVTSDIGVGIKSHLESDGWQVFGTSSFAQSKNIAKLDLSDSFQVDLFTDKLEIYKDWSLLCFFAGTMEPIGPFFDTDFEKWKTNFQVNFFSQLKILNMIWPYRSKAIEPNICFLAGGGTNSTFDNYSAYCLSKISLIKFVELVSSENDDGKFFIIGPGFMKTKIHNQTFEAGNKAGQNFQKTEKFMKGDGTTIEQLYRHIQWCIIQPRKAIGGRNFSTVHDPWETNKNFSKLLAENPEMFKLRRRENHN
jgi:short-subunit dehydrogenase